MCAPGSGECVFARPGQHFFQVVRTLLYRLERQDSCMALDMNIDLGGISLIPDCTVYLYPCLRSGSDSPDAGARHAQRSAERPYVPAPQGVGNGKQSGETSPYVVLREGDHPLPRINYCRTDIPYLSWMDSVRIVLSGESYNADARLVPFRMKTEIIPRW